ncbi:MAG: hypothetical protein BGO43_13100 [Gammaproteobacteria bacterium 39-13]|nr:hypothetical protein [Gammaproteobacteria bacterium]OJV92719.1 MAG: hypothetical protein BGO43_13100 [Gammaproteobacteria bacterium 39-13]
MNGSIQPDVVDEFFSNIQEAENYLTQYGSSNKDTNNGVSLSYENIAKKAPLFTWFSAATMGSVQVGKVIKLVDNPVLSHCESTNTLSLGFSYGNQKIHNNIVALYNIYQDHGLDGLRILQKWDRNEVYISGNVILAFEKYSEVESKAKNYAAQVNLPSNDISVVKYIISQPENIELLKDASKFLVQHEQVIVDPMYEKIYFDNGKTVGEVLNDSNYLEKLAANHLELSGAKILDEYIPTDGYDFTSYDQRVGYFDKVLDEYFNILAQDGGLERLIDQRETMIASLDADFIAYGQHFHEPEHMSFSIANNFEGIQNENYAVTWDNTNQQWRHVSNADITKHPGGFWVSPDTYPEVMNIVEKFPLIENTFYYDTSTNQPYLFCSAGFLPNLPPNYSWIALKTYLQPSSSSFSFSYENGGSLWVLIKNTIPPTIADSIKPNNMPSKLNLADIINLFDDSLSKLIESLPVHEEQLAQANESNTTSQLTLNDFPTTQSLVPIPEPLVEMV